MTNRATCKPNNQADPNYPFRSYRNKDGEIVYSVPLEVSEDRTPDEPVDVEEEQKYTELRFKGGKPMRVHFVETTNRTVAYDQCTWLNTHHTRERRYAERYQLPKTYDSKDPDECIWDRSPRMRRNDDGYTITDYSDLPGLIEAFITEQLPTSDLYVQVYRLSANGFKPKEISAQLGIEQEMVYYYRKEALRVAQEYRRKYFDEGQYVFPEAKQHRQNSTQPTLDRRKE